MVQLIFTANSAKGISSGFLLKRNLPEDPKIDVILSHITRDKTCDNNKVVFVVRALKIRIAEHYYVIGGL